MILVKTIEWGDVWVIEPSPKCRFFRYFLCAVNSAFPIDFVPHTFIVASIASRSEILKVLTPTTRFIHRPM